MDSSIPRLPSPEKGGAERTRKRHATPDAARVSGSRDGGDGELDVHPATLVADQRRESDVGGRAERGARDPQAHLEPLVVLAGALDAALRERVRGVAELAVLDVGHEG